MLTRSELLNTLSRKELITTLAEILVHEKQQECDNNGEEMTDDVDEFCESLDGVGEDIQEAIETIIS